jgi:hypothetical protein
MACTNPYTSHAASQACANRKSPERVCTFGIQVMGDAIKSLVKKFGGEISPLKELDPDVEEVMGPRTLEPLRKH